MKKKIVYAICLMIFCVALTIGCDSAVISETNVKPNTETQTLEKKEKENSDQKKSDTPEKGKGPAKRKEADEVEQKDTRKETPLNSIKQSPKEESGERNVKPSVNKTTSSVSTSNGQTSNTKEVGGATNNKSNGNTAANSTQAHTHNWIAQTKVVHHDAVGHNETQIVQAAWDETTYGYKVICGCGAMFNDDNEWEIHSVNGCNYSYYVDRVPAGTIHHEALTKQVWVQDQAAYDETITVGYKCNCGQTK